MGRRTAEAAGAEGKEGRVQLGDYWLEWRVERAQWCIAWYDPAARTRRRRSTGIGGGSPDNPPDEARRALAEHYLESSEPEAPKAAAEAPVADMLTHWLTEHVAGLNDAERYAYSAKHWLRFFDREKKLGKIIGGATVSDISNKLVDRFIAFRRAEGVGGHTISRDLAALRGALNHNWREERLATVPFIKDVDAKDKAKPRDRVLTAEEVAALLEAAYSSPERFHVFLYTLIQLSTCGRSEAILDLHDGQIRDGLFYFLDDERAQTSKRRSIVPIAPTVAPWLEGISGKVIVYRAPIAERKWKDPAVPEFFSKPCLDIGNAFEGCLIAAGLSRPVLGPDGEPQMLAPRAKLGETEPRPALRGIATPNTLRHTAITEMHRRGVPEAQIDAAAGHIGEGTGKRNYRHLRPDYLAELVGAVEDYWQEMKRYTTVHLRSQCGPNIVSFTQAQAGRRVKNA
jgi:integrase